MTRRSKLRDVVVDSGRAAGTATACGGSIDQAYLPAPARASFGYASNDAAWSGTAVNASRGGRT
jgi:hypothetical protein